MDALQKKFALTCFQGYYGGARYLYRENGSCEVFALLLQVVKESDHSTKLILKSCTQSKYQVPPNTNIPWQIDEYFFESGANGALVVKKNGTIGGGCFEQQSFVTSQPDQSQIRNVPTGEPGGYLTDLLCQYSLTGKNLTLSSSCTAAPRSLRMTGFSLTDSQKTKEWWFDSFTEDGFDGW